MTGPLPAAQDARTAPEGVVVPDLSRVLAVPSATRLMAIPGIEVIKAERSGAGGDTRGRVPPFLTGRQGAKTRERTCFLAANRGKQSLALDIARPERQAVARAPGVIRRAQ